MAKPFLSELRLFPFVFGPKGWAPCDGQLLPINQNQALFSLHAEVRGRRGTIHVEKNNPARALYGRLGFALVDADRGAYDLWEWHSPDQWNTAS